MVTLTNIVTLTPLLNPTSLSISLSFVVLLVAFVDPHLSITNTCLSEDLFSTSNMNISEQTMEGIQIETTEEMYNDITATLNNSTAVSLPLPQNNPILWHARPSGMNSTCTTVRLETIDPYNYPPIDASLFDNSIVHNTSRNPLTQSQSPSFPMLPYGSSNSSHQQFPRYQMTGLNPLGTPAMRTLMMAQYNQRHFWPRPPSLTDLQDFVCAWEGSLVGKIHSNRTSLNLAKALRRPTSPVTLGVDWPCRLEITFFLPKKAVNYTMTICGGSIDYMFVHITLFNNLDLYNHLMSKNLCAKIDLPSQTLILSTTESKYHYLGIVFPRVASETYEFEETKQAIEKREEYDEDITLNHNSQSNFII
ncbi:Mediator of RNA polymerase II transcription subunit 25, partial [Mucuna pruriens]